MFCIAFASQATLVSVLFVSVAVLNLQGTPHRQPKLKHFYLFLIDVLIC